MIKLWMNVALALAGTTAIVATNHELGADNSPCKAVEVCKKMCDGTPGECMRCPDGRCCIISPDGQCTMCPSGDCKKVGCKTGVSAGKTKVDGAMAATTLPSKCSKSVNLANGSKPCCSGPMAPCRK